MRLIDADALHDDLRKKQKWIVKREGMYNEGYTYDQVHFAIDDQPTIDAVLVGYGIWIKDDFGVKCGACGLYAYRDKFGQPWESPYCPNCGARMVEE